MIIIKFKITYSTARAPAARAIPGALGAAGACTRSHDVSWNQHFFKDPVYYLKKLQNVYVYVCTL